MHELQNAERIMISPRKATSSCFMLFSHININSNKINVRFRYVSVGGGGRGGGRG